MRDAYVLDFLNLNDEYGESDLEEALSQHLKTFLLELAPPPHDDKKRKS